MATASYRREAEALRALKARLGDQYLANVLSEWDRHDANLLRWLRARDLNVDKAEKLLKESMIWRRENDIDKIATWRKPAWMESGFKFYASGLDKEGSVISIIPLCTWLPNNGFGEGRKEQVVRFANQVLEQGVSFMKQESLKENKIFNQVVIVFDFDKYPLSRMLSKENVELMMECLRIFEANYPETLKQCFVINAPVIFEILFNLLKPFVTARTLGKLKVFGSKTEQWRAALLEISEPEELPSQYGGSNSACKYYDFNDGLDRLPELPDLPSELYHAVTIKAGESFSVEHNVETPGTQLLWNFRTENYDIGFKFFHEDTKLFDCVRADSHLYVQRGLRTCEKPGVYKLVFDNSFSKFRSKVVQYAIVEQTPSCKVEPRHEKLNQLG